MEGRIRSIATATKDDRVVEIPDPILRRALTAVLGKAESEPVTRGEMATLEHLNVSFDELSDLTGLEFAVNLIYLTLNNNRIRDINSLASLTKLQELSLGHNKIDDVRPLAPLGDLRMLSITKNQISDISALGSLVKLEQLFIEDNLVSDISPLAFLPELSNLRATANSIDDIEALAKSPRMKELRLAHNLVSDLSALADLKELEVLFLNGNAVVSLAPLSELSMLHTLILSYNEIVDVVPLAGLAELRHLELFSNAVSDLSPLRGLTRLNWLDLGANGIDNIAPLSSLTELWAIWLEGNRISEVSPLGALEKLRYLFLDNNLVSDISPLGNIERPSILFMGFNSISDISVFEDIKMDDFEFANLSNNLISDISPLVRNGGFHGHLSPIDLDLRHNPLNDRSLNEHIPALLERRVLVLYLDDHGDLPRDATHVELGSVTAGTINPGYDIDYFHLELQERKDVHVFTTGGGAPVPVEEEGFKDLYLVRFPSANKVARLYDQRGRLIAYDGRDRPNIDMRLSLEPGSYRLAIGSSGDGSRRYRLNLVDIEAISSDVAIPDLRLRAVVEAELGKKPGAAITSIDMAKLTVIDAPGSGITDLTGLEFATNLFAVYLNNNLIADISPLAAAVHIQELHLQSNHISDVSPLKGFRELFTLLLHSNSIDDISALARLDNLRFLFLQSNNVTDISPLTDKFNLIELRLGANSISDLHPLANNPRLWRLYVQSNLISDLSPLATVAGLRLLDASDNRISNVSPLVELKNLRYLYLGSNLITDISPFEGMIQLNVLHLESNEISDISPLPSMTGLSQAYFQYNRVSDVPRYGEPWPDSPPHTLNLRGNPLSQDAIAYLDSFTDSDERFYAPDDHGDARQHASVLKLGARVTGDVPNNDVDFFRLDIKQATDVRLLLTTYGVLSDMAKAQLFDQSNNELAANGKVGGAPPTKTLAVNRRFPAGTYYIKVFSDRFFDRLRYALSATAFASYTSDVPLLFSPSNQQRQSFVRVIHHDKESGWVAVEGIDDKGRMYDRGTVLAEGGRATQFSSGDLLQGNPGKLLRRGIGDWSGSLRLDFHSILDFEVLGYTRGPTGFVTTMHDFAPIRNDQHWVATFNPAANQTQRSSLRILNPSDRTAVVTIEAIDDIGSVSDGKVELVLAPNTAQTLTADELELGGSSIEGYLGSGVGKWQLQLKSSQPIRVLSLLESPDGYLANLSAVPSPPSEGMHQVHLFPAADTVGRQGLLRVINHSQEAGDVRVQACDDTDWSYPPVVLSLDALESVQVNSVDLEQGNQGKGLSDGIGPGIGDWRLVLSSNLDIDVLAYISMPDGFLTAVQPTDSMPRRHFLVPTFNPGSNHRQLSILRLINPGAEAATVTIRGIDDLGDSPGDDVQLSILGNSVRTVRAEDLELGGADLNGAIGDGRGKWRLKVTSDHPIWIMSLLEHPTGHLTNLTGSRRPHFDRPDLVRQRP